MHGSTFNDCLIKCIGTFYYEYIKYIKYIINVREMQDEIYGLN